jgi:hypothetical protein
MHRHAVKLAVLASLALAFTAGCGSNSGSQAPPSAERSQPTAASSSSAPHSQAELAAWVDQAKLPRSAVGATKPSAEESGRLRTIATCGRGIEADDHVAYAHHWNWRGSRVIYLDHDVFAYRDLSGAEAVEQFRARAQGCDTYEMSDPFATARIDVAGDYRVEAPSGIENAYAYCERSTTLTPRQHKGEKASICTAVISRGSFLAVMRVFGSTPGVSSAQAALDRVLEPGARALARAVPAA